MAGRTGVGGLSGGVVRWAEYDRDRRRLYVLGQAHALPARDSALVVMVDRVDGARGAPAVVGTAWIGLCHIHASGVRWAAPTHPEPVRD